MNRRLCEKIRSRPDGLVIKRKYVWQKNRSRVFDPEKGKVLAIFANRPVAVACQNIEIRTVFI